MKDKVFREIAFRLPRFLTYWCGIVLWANATQGEYGNCYPSDVTMVDALKRWGDVG